MTKRLSRVFRFAEPIVHGSLIRQILVALVLGAALAFVWPTAAKDVGILGEIFVTALKGVAPVLVFVLVTSAIANSSMSTEMHIRPVIALYLASTFGAAMASVAVSFMFPTTITLTGAAQSSAAPGEISQVLTQLLLNVVDNPVRAIANANYIGILAWAVAVGMILRKSREETRIVLGDASSAVSSIVQIVIRFAPIGIFGLVSHTLATEGFQVMLEYAQLLLVLLGAMAFVALVLNPFIVWVATHDNPYPLTFMVLRESGVSAFFTRSSAANIPVNMDICRRLKLPESTYAISIPVGSTINMAGAAVTITVITLSAAHSLGIQVDMFSAIFLSVIASVCAAGTSGVPGGSLMLIPLACGLFGIDQDTAMQVVAVGFIISVLQDSTETGLNSSSDVLFTIAACYRADRIRAEQEAARISVNYDGLPRGGQSKPPQGQRQTFRRGRSPYAVRAFLQPTFSLGIPTHDRSRPDTQGAARTRGRAPPI